MGGKGSSGGNNIPRPRGQAATGKDPFGGQQGQQRSQQMPRVQQMPNMRQTSNRGPQRRQTTEQDRLRMNPSEMAPLTTPARKPPPLTPLPARIGVRQERRPVDPAVLAISPTEQKQLQRDMDIRRGYGPTFAISGDELDRGSLLGDDEDAAGFGGYGLGL